MSVARWIALGCAVLAVHCGGTPLQDFATPSTAPSAAQETVSVTTPPEGGAPADDRAAAEDLRPPSDDGAGRLALATSAGAFPVFTDPGELPQMQAASEGGQPLVLAKTSVVARLTGAIAEVEVSQTWNNPYARPIEGKYVFPLPENAAIYRMRMTVGERVIESSVKERSAAERSYEDARRSGHTAALLEQERPNVFTQSVANIEPQRPVEVVVRYVQDLTFDAGRYEFVFPMVVGPRFVQPGLVADAARVTPPVLGKGERSGTDVALQVTVDGAVAPADFQVPTHEVNARRLSDGGAHIALTEKRTIPNRDFVLRYRVAEERPRATMLLSGAREGFFTLVVHPPTLDVDQLVGRREIVFVVDVSGSMRGAPLALCKAAMREALGRLRPVDTFNVITFAGATGKAFERPVPANAATVRRALAYVEGMSAGGGTRMLDAVDAALGSEIAGGRHRYVFFLTDGYVAVEDQIQAKTRSFVNRLEARGSRARVFGFGVGASPNRALLEGLAREGKGATVYASSREDPARAVNHFYRYIDSSVLRDLRVDFGGLEVTETVPQELPDLFASRPLVVHGRFRGERRGPVVVRAVSARGAVELPVTVAPPPRQDARGVLGTLWARARIGELEGHLASGRAEAAREITSLGVTYQLATRFTSFVAVDRSRRAGDGAPPTIAVPLDAPEGTEFERDALQKESPAPTLDSGEPTASRHADRPEATVTEANGPPAADRGPRGCGCRVGNTGPVDRGAWLLAAALLVAFCRRRRHDARHTNPGHVAPSP